MPRTWVGPPWRGPPCPFFVDRRRSAMAVRTLKTLVLRGVAVTGDVVTGRTRIAGYQANGRLPVPPFSMRHPSPGCLAFRLERRQARVDNADAEHASVRAGRPESWTGV